MKDKRWTIWFLIITVVVIWGTIIYKAIRRNPETNAGKEIIIAHQQKSVKGKYKYSLQLNYPDPFSRKDEAPIKKDHSSIDKKIKTTPWPNLKYNGRISTKENVRAHFTYDESSMIIKPGEIFAENCVLKTICSDSVLIVKAHEKKWYKKIISQ